MSNNLFPVTAWVSETDGKVTCASYSTLYCVKHCTKNSEAFRRTVGFQTMFVESMVAIRGMFELRFKLTAMHWEQIMKY